MASVGCSGVSLRIVAALVVVLQLSLGSASPGRSFRGRLDHSDRTVGTQDIESTLQSSLHAALGGGDRIIAQRLAHIEERMWQTFQALPKNAAGRLAPRSVRYMVHGYFAKEHGWLINGMEPDTMQPNVTEMHEVDILEDKAPAFVESLLETRQGGRGLSLSDVVAMVAALERLVFDESISLLESAYALNGHSTSDIIHEEALHEVLTSYLVVFEQGIKVNLTNRPEHQRAKKRMSFGSDWMKLLKYELDAVQNFRDKKKDETNASAKPEYSFQAASEIVEDLAQGYGKWQNAECSVMKKHLMSLDADGSGRVPLKSFYSQPATTDYHFEESVDYLRKIGALDEASSWNPKVRIANYLVGPSNCIASSAYYSVCCISECESLRNTLEGKIQAPVASAQHLLDVVGNLSSSTVDSPRNLPTDLTTKLQAIADQNSGEVPLHGRLFTQWMHYAFPNECPYPHIAESQAALTAVHWRENTVRATTEEKLHHITYEPMEAGDEEHHAMSQWTDDEILPLHHHEPSQQSRSLFAGTLRTVVQLAMLFVVCRIAFSTWQQALPAGKGKKRAEGFLLPLKAKIV